MTHKHSQMMLNNILSSLFVLKKKIKVALGWQVDPSMGHIVSCKKLRDEGLHTFLGMVGYCVKDNGQDQFEFVHHNMSADDMNVGKMEYTKFGKVGLKNHVSLSHNNIL